MFIFFLFLSSLSLFLSTPLIHRLYYINRLVGCLPTARPSVVIHNGIFLIDWMSKIVFYIWSVQHVVPAMWTRGENTGLENRTNSLSAFHAIRRQQKLQAPRTIRDYVWSNSTNNSAAIKMLARQAGRQARKKKNNENPTVVNHTGLRTCKTTGRKKKKKGRQCANVR